MSGWGVGVGEGSLEVRRPRNQDQRILKAAGRGQGVTLAGVTGSWGWSPQEMKAPHVGLRGNTGAWKQLPWARRGTGPPPGQWRGEFWGKHRQGEPSFCHKKAKGVFTEVAKCTGRVPMTEHRVEGLRLVGGEQKGGRWGLVEPHLQERREVQGFLWQ